MNPSEPTVPKTLAELQAELDAVKRREAEFRVHMVQEFLDRGERNTYLHTLHEERAALIKRDQAASADIEALTRKLEVEEARTASLAAELRALRASLSWRLTAPLRALAGAPAAPAPGPDTGVPGGVFTYYLHTSPFRVYREASFTLRGWAWPQDGRAVTGIRASVGGKVFTGRIGLEEPEVIARYGAQPSNPKPGFEVTFDTPPGRHLLSLEAQIEGSEWRWIVRATIWSEAAPA